MSTYEISPESDEVTLAHLEAEFPEAFVQEDELQQAEVLEIVNARQQLALVRIYGIQAEATAAALEPEKLGMVLSTLANIYKNDCVVMDHSRLSIDRAQSILSMWELHLQGDTDDVIAIKSDFPISQVRSRRFSLQARLKRVAPPLKKLVEEVGGEFIKVDDERLISEAYEPAGGGRWLDDAICPQIGPELYFPTSGTMKKLQAYCLEKCPVQALCLETAIQNDIKEGIWGGLNNDQRDALVEARQRGTA